MENRLRIAMVGLGDIAQKAYLPLVANHRSITPILSTRNQETLEQLKAQYRIEESYSDIRELIAAKPNAVMVHTATDSHYSIVAQLLNANIATFVDKPASFHIAEVEHMIQLAKLKQTPLYLGFNRRFAPLVQPLNEGSYSHVRWQKNRVNLPDEPRNVIFNDFIHVLDGLRYLAGVSTELTQEQLTVSAHYQGKLLSNVLVQFEHNGCLFEASMNRSSGKNEERIELFGLNEKIEIDNLTSGFHYKNGTSSPIGFNDWQSYLYTRGFVDMIEDWLATINNGYSSDSQLNDVLLSHQLCEQLVSRII